jgi:type VI secretion system protein ImpF
MATPESRALPLQSLLDRFLNPYDPMTAPGAAKDRLNEAVRRDLEWMLNTRRVPPEAPAHLTELRRSVYMWGLPDLSAFATAAKPDRVKLKRIVQEAIAAVEPRLRDVRVDVPQEPEGKSDKSVPAHALRFTIAATLVAPPCVDKVAFNTVMDLGTGDCQVEAGG